MPAKHTPNFRRLLTSAMGGEVLVPVLQSALWSPNFKSFSVEVRGFQIRKPDSWFHPSTHPLMAERFLYWYLADPDKLVAEPFDPHGTMAVTQGHFWHEFIGHVGKEQGILTATEVYVEDVETGARGSMDGLVDHEVVSVPEPEVFEFKTMHPAKARKIAPGHPESIEVLESYRQIAPGYYAQGQEYMRMSGYRRHRSLVLSMEYPYPMREIVMPYDRLFANQVADKYRSVRQAVADGRVPRDCCQAKDCPSRALCAL